MRRSSSDPERDAIGAPGGVMRRAWRGIAIPLAAVSLAAAFGCASAKHPDANVANAPARAATSDTPAKPAPAATGALEQALFTEDGDGARLVLSADAPMLYTAYEPRPDLLVLDLPGFVVADKFVPPPAA